MVKWTDQAASVTRAEDCSIDPTPPITLPHDVLERVNELLQDDNYIAAIAVVREETGASLLDSGTYVDGLRRKVH
jgi:sulfopyruvate decarboxylase TPP-binding subunit